MKYLKNADKKNWAKWSFQSPDTSRDTNKYPFPKYTRQTLTSPSSNHGVAENSRPVPLRYSSTFLMTFHRRFRLHERSDAITSTQRLWRNSEVSSLFLQPPYIRTFRLTLRHLPPYLRPLRPPQLLTTFSQHPQPLCSYTSPTWPSLSNILNAKPEPFIPPTP